MSKESIKANPVRWQPAAAVACFVGAVLALTSGFLLTTGWVLNAERHWLLHDVGLTLLILGIPILILGGHCLDLMERKGKRSARESRVPGNGGTKPLHVVVTLVSFWWVLGSVCH